MKYSLALTLALAFSATVAMPAAHAQSAESQEPIEPTSAQLELNNQGVQAIREKDFEKAVRLFRSSTDLGALNITYVNMGRAYQYMGDCENAEASYDKALKAQPVKAPSVAEIETAITRYRKELIASCASASEATAPSGSEQESAGKGDENIKSIKPIPQPPEKSAAPYIWMGGGAAAVAAGIVLDTVPGYATNGRTDAEDFIGPSLYVLGGAAVVYGIYTLMQ